MSPWGSSCSPYVLPSASPTGNTLPGHLRLDGGVTCRPKTTSSAAEEEDYASSPSTLANSPSPPPLQTSALEKPVGIDYTIHFPPRTGPLFPSIPLKWTPARSPSPYPFKGSPRIAEVVKEVQEKQNKMWGPPKTYLRREQERAEQRPISRHFGLRSETNSLCWLLEKERRKMEQRYRDRGEGEKDEVKEALPGSDRFYQLLQKSKERRMKMLRQPRSPLRQAQTVAQESSSTPAASKKRTYIDLTADDTVSSDDDEYSPEPSPPKQIAVRCPTVVLMPFSAAAKKLCGATRVARNDRRGDARWAVSKHETGIKEA